MTINLKMKDMPEDSRPQEKMFNYGAEALSEHELLAIILRTGTRGENILSLTQRFLIEIGGVDGLLYATEKDIQDIKGFGRAKAAQVLALVELFQRFKRIKVGTEVSITSPKSVAEMLTNEMAYIKQEKFRVLLLNTKNKVVGIRDVFKGSLDTAIVHPREVFNEALKFSASRIVICHNHPSGDPTPSKEDINITNRIKECGVLMGIELLDHIVIAKNGYFSMKEKGIL
ncbi:MAG: RadC family protein [Clostridium sp.]